MNLVGELAIENLKADWIHVKGIFFFTIVLNHADVDHSHNYHTILHYSFYLLSLAFIFYSIHHYFHSFLLTLSSLFLVNIYTDYLRC